MIPRHSGSYKIPPVRFSYFDVSKRGYVTLSSPEFPLEVEKGSANENESNTTVMTAKEDVKILGNDIRYIKTSAILKKTGTGFFGSPLFYILMALPLVLFLLFSILFKKYMESLKDTVSIKSRKATKMAKKRLEIANKHLQSNNYDDFYNELFKSINGYLSDRLNISIADLSKERIAETLQRRGADDQAINFLISTLNKSEFARFAPVKTSSAMQTDYNDTIATISKIEEELK